MLSVAGRTLVTAAVAATCLLVWATQRASQRSRPLRTVRRWRASDRRDGDGCSGDQPRPSSSHADERSAPLVASGEPASRMRRLRFSADARVARVVQSEQRLVVGCCAGARPPGCVVGTAVTVGVAAPSLITIIVVWSPGTENPWSTRQLARDRTATRGPGGEPAISAATLPGSISYIRGFPKSSTRTM